MVVKLIFLFVLLSIDASVTDDVIKVPKKFIRSRYSHRKTTTIPTTELPTTNYDSVDMVTDVFSEELLPNKVEELATNDPFNLNETTTELTVTEESLSTSTLSDVIEITTDGQTGETGQSEGQNEEKDYSQCGEKVDENHPWIAVLVHTDPTGKSRKKTLSKGVLIDQRHVLTTVSSLHNSRPFWIVSEVRLGDTPVWGGETEVNKSSILRIGIQEIFHHKNRDIALIQLAENVNFTSFIRPICLPENDQFNYTELYLHTCKKSKQTKSSVVNTVTASPLTILDCEIMFSRKRAKLTSEEFCAWDQAGDSCTGDLGGPLIAMDNGKYMVIGLNSHINSKVKFNFDDYPGIYVRVGSHLPWIKKVTGLIN